MTQELPPTEVAQTPPELPPSCNHCHAPFQSQYFWANGAAFCNGCADALRGSLAGEGSSASRFLRAILLGCGAAAVSAIGYGLFMGLTGYEFAYVTIGMGWLIGAAVRKGSGGRGGWRYGVLAVLLAYCAIAFSYFGVAVSSEIQKRSATAPAISKTVTANEVLPLPEHCRRIQ